jgi:hypothetical protein
LYFSIVSLTFPDNYLIGVVSDDPSNLQFNLVKIDLTSHQLQNITSYPIYNTTNLSLRKTIAYDPLSNTIYFPGLSPYSQWPTFNSYSLNSSLAMVFPIVTFNQSLLTLTWGVSSSSSGLFGINGNGWLGQLNPATGNYFPSFVSKSSPPFYFGPQGSSLTFDSKAMALTFCDHSSGYSLVTFDFSSQTLTPLVYPCQKYPFQYISA